MKKTALLLSLCLLFLCAFGVSACAGPVAPGADDEAQVTPGESVKPEPEPELEPPYSETFEGTISEQTYESEEEAARAFLETEIAGAAADVSFVGLQKEETLSEQETAALAIDEDLREGLLSVTRCSVEYTETLHAAGTQSLSLRAAADAASATKRAEVYLLTYTGMFRFFVPQTQTGGQISSSYFASTFLAEDYVNCTMDVEMTQTRAGSTFVSSAVAKATQNVLWEHDFYFTDGEATGESELYLVDSVEGIGDIFRHNGGEWDASFVGFDADYTINEYFMEWFQYRFGALDHSYFIKTETGYALDPDKYEAYLQTLPDYPGGAFELEYTINVKDGRMADVTMAIAYGEYSSRMTLVFSDFGTTVIEIPDEVSKLIPA